MLLLAIANNFQMAETRNNTVNVEQRLTKPEPKKHIKLNVDGAFFEEEGTGAVAAILRDERGTFLAAKCSYIPYAADAMIAEARAMSEGLNFANQPGFSHVEAERILLM